MFFFQAEDGIRDYKVTGVQTCALPIYLPRGDRADGGHRAAAQADGGDHGVGMAEKDPRVPPELEQLGLDPSMPGSEDTLRLIRFLSEQGAGSEELAEAFRAGTLGPLALELALRPPGGAVPFAEAAAGAGLEVEEAAALWRALGFPDPLGSVVVLTQAQI